MRPPVPYAPQCRAPFAKADIGLKRGLEEDVPSQQKEASAARPGGARLLSSAVMQSLQPARTAPTGPVAVGGGGKRRKSTGHGSGGGDGGSGDSGDYGDDGGVAVRR